MSNSEKNIRAFLAVEPPEGILQAVIGLQEKLKREIGGKLSWTRPGGQHLTLKFFGDVPTEDIDAIGRSVQNRLQAGWSVNLKIAGLGLFPDARKPRVLWCAAAGDVAKLTALQKQLDNDFAPLGFAPETRPFRPHLTLARIREPQAVRGLNEALEGQGLSALLSNTKEVEAAQGMLGGAMLLGAQADETGFKRTAGSAAVLHLAMHTVMDEAEPLQTCLLYTSPSPRDS